MWYKKTFFINFKGLSAARNFLTPKSGLLNIENINLKQSNNLNYS